MRGKYIQDQQGPVQYGAVQYILHITELDRAQFIITDHARRPMSSYEHPQFIEFTASDVGHRVDTIQILGQTRTGFPACRLQQFLEFIQRILQTIGIPGADTDQNKPFLLFF